MHVSGKNLSLIRFANDPYTLYNRLRRNTRRLSARFRKHVNWGKTQCWAFFVICKATSRKTVIKPKFNDRFSGKSFSAAIDQCTIKCPISCPLKYFKLPNEGAKLSKYWSDVINLDNSLRVRRSVEVSMVESDMWRIDFFFVFNFLCFFFVCLFVCFFFLRFLSERGASEAQKVSFYIVITVLQKKKRVQPESNLWSRYFGKVQWKYNNKRAYDLWLTRDLYLVYPHSLLACQSLVETFKGESLHWWSLNFL